MHLKRKNIENISKSTFFYDKHIVTNIRWFERKFADKTDWSLTCNERKRAK